MATYSGARTVYVASAASVGADLVILSDGGFAVKVTNVSGTAPLFWTVSHQGGSCPIPTTNGTTTTGASGVFVTGAAVNASTNARHAAQFGTIVQVVSTGSPSYMVEVQGNHSTS